MKNPFLLNTRISIYLFPVHLRERRQRVAVTHADEKVTSSFRLLFPFHFTFREELLFLERDRPLSTPPLTSTEFTSLNPLNGPEKRAIFEKLTFVMTKKRP